MADWGLGAYPNGGNIFTGSLGDIWFMPGLYIDLSIEANRRRFISAAGEPVYLGANGEGPTGAVPLVYLSGALASWHTNKGTGGGFTLTGSPASLVEVDAIPVTYRWALPTDYLPTEIDCIPSISNVSFTPALVSLGKDLGHRASISVNFFDHRHIFNREPYDQGTFWGKWRGRYGTKLRGAPLRIIRGAVGQALVDMDTRHYLVDASAGPDPNSGAYVIEAKDILKFADDDRAQAPALSSGSLAGSITISAVSVTLSPTGIGNTEYPASGFLSLGGKEIVSFTRAGDVLTIVRGQLGSVASAHNAGDRAQLVLRYTGNDPADIIYDLMTNYAGISTSYINLTEWQTETSTNLGVIYARTISEPTSVNTLVSEIIEQAALSLWWDDRALKIGLAVLREISTDTAAFTEDNIIAGSMRVQEQPSQRISQIWTYYGTRDPTDLGAKEDNFRAVLATVDLEKETEYGSAVIYKVNGTWIETEAAAQRLNAIQISRFQDPPRNFRFSLIAGELISLVQGYTLEWWGNQNTLGVTIPALIQITQIAIYSDRIEVEAEEMLASGDLTSLVSVVFLLDTGTGLQFTVPASWNDADNSVHVIGGGAGGNTTAFGGNGSGGGAYSSVSNLNLTPGAMLNYRVGLGGVVNTAGGDTWFNGASLAASSVGAKGGLVAGAGGAAGSGIGTIKFSGGAGSSGGGGGAAGPNGNGKNGAASSGSNGGGGGGADGGFDASGTSGGNNRFNFGGGNSTTPSGDEGGGGAGGAAVEEGGPGGAGEQIWTQTVAPITSAGPGGGGGGGGVGGDGGDGGSFGGGGGAGGGSGRVGGSGAQGLIVIMWRGI
jgi:hypothetical protein